MQRPTISEKSALNIRSADRDYAVRLLQSVCCLAGNPEFLAQRNSTGKNSLAAAIERHDTARLFDWLVEALSYQGIANRIAHDYMRRHGKARWVGIKASLARSPSAPSCAATGPSTIAATARSPRPVLSRATWPLARCRACRCATAT
jgi:hypothetical protein